VLTQLVTFGRVIHKDLKLHDGFIIPSGTFIGIPAHAIAHDAAFYESPSVFSPFRFVTKDLVEKGNLSFVATNASSLSWGYGKHACSGRFFAANEIKLIFAYFLLNYDFKFASPAKRPQNQAFELQTIVDESVEILVRKRHNV
jgi:cytochrome P450